MPDRFQLEDGSGNYLTEDGSGASLLEPSTVLVTGGGMLTAIGSKGTRESIDEADSEAETDGLPCT